MELEATGNSILAVRLLKPHVGRVVIANPLQVPAIAHAKIKTDQIDAVILLSSIMVVPVLARTGFVRINFGLGGEKSIAPLCRREGNAESLNDVIPAGAYFSRNTVIIEMRRKIKKLIIQNLRLNHQRQSI